MKETMHTQSQPPKIYYLFISRDEPRLRAGWRLLLHTTMTFFFAMLAGFFSFIALSIFGMKITSSFQEIPKYVEIIITLPPILLATFIARTVIDQRSFQSLGFTVDRQAVFDLLVGFFIPLILLGLIFLFDIVVGWTEVDSLAWKTASPMDWISSVAVGLGYFIVVGIQEELIFRGYQLQNLIDGLDLPKGLILSSIFFAFAHLLNPHVSLLSTLGIFLSGLFLAFAWVRTQQLWLPIGLHIGWNFFEGVIFGFPVSGTDTARLISHTVTGPKVLTGGEFGPEAGLILLPALAIGSGLIWLYTRSRSQDEPDPSLADALFGPHISR
jgi:membrane protease YdiL (CAAX protease family)